MSDATPTQSTPEEKTQSDKAPKTWVTPSMVMNMLMSRASLFNQSLDTRRDIHKDCGYPLTHGPEDYANLYDSGDPIPARVVEVMAKESWQVTPEVYEEEDENIETEFEKEWKALTKQLQPEPDYFTNEQGSPIWSILRRADEQSGIGRYGIILLGLNDEMSLSSPAKAYDREVEPPGKRAKLLYIRVFAESSAAILTYDTNKNSPRYGKPLTYELSFFNPENVNNGTVLEPKTEVVHWTRVIHVVDNAAESEIFGVPRLKHVFHRILDLQKLYPGSAEMYYLGAFPGISFESGPNMLPGEIDIDMSAVKDQVENYMNGFQRFLALFGVNAKSLAPQVVDPTPQMDKHLEAICIKIPCPIRIFKGSERGEQASSQDDASWNDRLRTRQWDHITANMIRPFVNRLISLNVLPRPKQLFVFWPALDSQTPGEKSLVAFQRTQSIAQYNTSEARRSIAPIDFWTRIIGFDRKEATAIIENAEVEAKKLEAEQLRKMEAENEMQLKLEEQKAKNASQANGNGGDPKRPAGMVGGAAGDGGGRNGDTGSGTRRVVAGT